jgi:hypothetical protein
MSETIILEAINLDSLLLQNTDICEYKYHCSDGERTQVRLKSQSRVYKIHSNTEQASKIHICRCGVHRLKELSFVIYHETFIFSDTHE